MTVATPSQPAAESPAPAPLGWCSWCLGERDDERAAVTVFAGTTLCRECNKSANEEQDDQQDAMATMAAQASAQLRGLFQGETPSGSRPVGF